MPGTFVFNQATGTVYITGGTSGAPVTLNDLWLADLAGVCNLHTRTGLTAADGSPVGVTTALRPCEQFVMGGALGDLYFIVSNFTGFTSITLRIIGTFPDGSGWWEDIVVTGNGTYATTWPYRTVTSTQVISVTGTGSFDYILQQGRWGLVEKYTFIATYSILTYVFNSNFLVLYFGDGVTSCYFQDNNSILHAEYTLTYIMLNSTVQIGVDSISTPNFATWYCKNIGYPTSPVTGTSLKIYNAKIYLISNYLYSESIEIKRSQIASQQYAYIRAIINLTIEYMHLLNQAIGPRIYGVSGSFSMTDIIVWEPSAPLYKLFFGNAGTYNFNKMQVFGGSATSYDFRASNAAIINLIDCIITIATIYLTTTGTKLYIKKSFNIKVVDKSGSAINGAAVKLFNKNETQEFSTTTGFDGKITTQQVLVAYAQAVTTTLTDYNPFRLEISAVGFVTLKIPAITISGPIDIIEQLRRLELPWIEERAHNA